MKRTRFSFVTTLTALATAGLGLLIAGERARAEIPALFGPTPLLSWTPDATGGGGTASLTIEDRQVSLQLSPVDILAPGAGWFRDGVDTPLTEMAREIRCYRGVEASGGGSAFVAISRGNILGVLLPAVGEATSGSPNAGFVNSPAAGNGCFPYVNLALDADIEFFNSFGGGDLLRTSMLMMNTVNVLDFVFQREVGIRYHITYGNIWTLPPEPYYSTTTTELVDGMKDWWNLNRAWLPRDSAHLLSGKKMLNGRFGGTPQDDDGDYPGWICNQQYAYSVSSGGDVTNAFWRYFYLLSNVIHEQGHQWGSGHCYGSGCRLMCGDASCVVPILEFEPLTRFLISQTLSTRRCLNCLPLQNSPSQPDLIVEDIELPATMVQGFNYLVGVRIKNIGGSPAHSTVRILTWLTLDGNPFQGTDDIPMGGPGLEAMLPGVAVSLAPSESQTFYFDTYQVPMNALPGRQQFVVLVDAGAPPCGSLCEYNESNNLARKSVQVLPAYWDLHFEIVNAPVSAIRCGSTSWGVRITNVGTATSDNVCFVSGIGLYSGAGNWSANLGLFKGSSGNLAPGQSTTIQVKNYMVPCGALPQTQYIKAEVDYLDGCYDHYLAGNYGEHSISMR